jgi:hypothetical protein
MEIVEQTQTLTLDAIEQEAKAKYALGATPSRHGQRCRTGCRARYGRLRADAANGQGACARA